MKEWRRRILALGIAAVLVFSVAAYADVFLLDYSGYDFTAPGDIDDPAACYYAVGYVNAVNPTFLTFDYGTNEYTFYLEYSCFVSADTFGTTAVYTYGDFGGLPATFKVFCDPLPASADYGINPPNFTSPSSFADGSLELSGEFTSNLVFVVDLNTGNGSMQGEIEWLGGAQLGNIPLESREMSLSLNGVKYDPPNGPEGYFWQIDGQISILEPVSTEQASWGEIKTKYAGGN